MKELAVFEYGMKEVRVVQDSSLSLEYKLSLTNGEIHFV